jgi:hypothetical protein
MLLTAGHAILEPPKVLYFAAFPQDKPLRVGDPSLNQVRFSETKSNAKFLEVE